MKKMLLRRLRACAQTVGCGLLLCLATTVNLGGQETVSELSGVVRDPSGGVVPGATVSITNRETGRVLTTTTGGDGVYIARSLEPGRYSVRVQATGFSAAEVPDVLMLVSRNLRLDVTLQVGPVEQVVTVTEAAPLIDLRGTTVSHNVAAEEFNRLPKGRAFESLFLLSPSVNSGDIGGGFQVNGATGAENQFFIDGVSTNSLIDGRLRQSGVFEFLQEAQVKTGGIEAEFGGALGGVMVAATKSGGNAFHGDIHYYYFGSGVSAAPPRRLLLDPVTELNTSYIRDEKQKNNRNEFGGSIGGPILRDRLWFFAAASPRWTHRENDYLFGIPGSALEPDTIEQDRLDENFFAKVSFDPISRIRTNFSWLNTTTATTGFLPRYNAGPNGRTDSRAAAQPNKRLGFFQPQTSYTGSVDVTLSSRMLLTVRAGRFWDNFKTTGLPNFSAVQYSTSAFDLPANLLAEVPEGQRQAINYSTTPRQINTFHDISTRTFINVDYGVFGSLWGEHDVKLGVGTQKNVSNVNETYPGGGYVEIFWNRSFTSLVAGSPCNLSPCRGRYGYYAVNDRGLRGSAGANITHLYVQDKWRVHPRLTLNVGLRTEKEVIPSFRRDIQENAFVFDFEDKLAPRLGFAYDVRGDGNLKVSFSWGRFFDWTKYYLSREAYGGAVWRVFYRALDTPNVASLSGTNLPGADLWGSATGFRDRRVPSFGDLIDSDIKPMSTYMINTTVEYQVTPELVFRGSYVRNSLRRTIEDIGFLTAEGDEGYIHGNPGEGLGATQFTTGLTPTSPIPKAVRDYDAMELSLTRRFANRWFGSASYVLSRLHGNYAGLASSDEVLPPSTGFGYSTSQQQGAGIFRPGGNLNRDFDVDELMWDSHGNLDVQGPLPTDQTHVFKLYGSYNFPSGTEVGGFWYIGSGTPLSTRVVTANHTEVFVEGRGDLGRSDVLSKTDLMVAHTFTLAEGKTLRFELNMLNLFNQKTPRLRYYYLNHGAAPFRDSAAINLRRVDLSKGYDYRALLNATTDGPKAFDPRFGQDDLFDDGFQGRFGIKFTF